LTENVHLRLLSAKDLTDGSFLQVLGELTTVGEPDSLALLERYNYLAARKDTYFPYVVITADATGEVIIGTATLFIERKFIHGCGLVGHIEDVVVSSKARGGGYGKLILKCLLDVAKHAGCYKVILDCDESNVPFYEKCGLVKKGVQMALYY
jgi:glucosamine-phosphate N-acetyltransferase